MADQGVSPASDSRLEGVQHCAFARVLGRGGCLARRAAVRWARLVADLNGRNVRQSSLGYDPLKAMSNNPSLPERTSQGTPRHDFACVTAEMSGECAAPAADAEFFTEET
mmetsp:Transcript_13793/g.37773  ORF Transcript_13793/g.37773 Transcript_13793/m.37773 type:complete len:110 (-) Transcript_13793:201-530(-)